MKKLFITVALISTFLLGCTASKSTCGNSCKDLAKSHKDNCCKK